MKFKFFNFNLLEKNKRNNVVIKLENITKENIVRAYGARRAELNSLLQYDRGEKEISAPSLNSIVQSL